MTRPHRQRRSAAADAHQLTAGGHGGHRSNNLDPSNNLRHYSRPYMQPINNQIWAPLYQPGSAHQTEVQQEVPSGGQTSGPQQHQERPYNPLPTSHCTGEQAHYQVCNSNVCTSCYSQLAGWRSAVKAFYDVHICLWFCLLLWFLTVSFIIFVDQLVNQHVAKLVFLQDLDLEKITPEWLVGWWNTFRQVFEYVLTNIVYGQHRYCKFSCWCLRVIIVIYFTASWGDFCLKHVVPHGVFSYY